VPNYSLKRVIQHHVATYNGFRDDLFNPDTQSGGSGIEIPDVLVPTAPGPNFGDVPGYKPEANKVFGPEKKKVDKRVPNRIPTTNFAVCGVDDCRNRRPCNTHKKDKRYNEARAIVSDKIMSFMAAGPAGGHVSELSLNLVM